MNKTIPNFLIPILIIFAVGLYGQDDCPDDFEFYPPGEDEPGCIEYIDCNDNGAFDVGEPCYDDGDGGDHPGGGPPQAGDECDLCDHVYSGEEDHHGHCPAPTCDVVLDTDEDWEEHCNDDPDHCPEPPDGDGFLDYDEFHQADDGDGDNEEYGEHTVENCIAFTEGRGSYWIGDEEFAVWDDPNVDCNYLFDQIGYQPPAYMCSWTWGDGNPCGYTSDDPSAFHDHCGYTFSDGNTCDASFDNQGDFDAHQHCGYTFSDGNICGWAPWEDNTFHEHCDQVFPDGNPCGASFDNQGDFDAHQGDHADDGGDGGDHPGGGPPQAGYECDLCDHVYSGEEDHHGHCPAPTCDVVLDTDEDWEEHCNDDPDHCPEPPDGD